MPRKKIPFTPKELSQVETMAGYGLSVERIAAVLNMSKRTLERRLRETDGGFDALEKGRALAEVAVTQSAYEMAISKKHPVFTMFWLKCRAGWKETTVIEIDDEATEFSKLSKDERRERLREKIRRMKVLDGEQ